MKFSGKMCLKIILKVTKNQSFTLPSEVTFFEKPQGGGEGEKGQIDPPLPHPHSLVVFELMHCRFSQTIELIQIQQISNFIGSGIVMFRYFSHIVTPVPDEVKRFFSSWLNNDMTASNKVLYH